MNFSLDFTQKKPYYHWVWIIYVIISYENLNNCKVKLNWWWWWWWWWWRRRRWWWMWREKLERITLLSLTIFGILDPSLYFWSRNHIVTSQFGSLDLNVTETYHYYYLFIYFFISTLICEISEKDRLTCGSHLLRLQTKRLHEKDRASDRLLLATLTDSILVEAPDQPQFPFSKVSRKTS